MRSHGSFDKFQNIPRSQKFTHMCKAMHAHERPGKILSSPPEDCEAWCMHKVKAKAQL